MGSQCLSLHSQVQKARQSLMEHHQMCMSLFLCFIYLFVCFVFYTQTTCIKCNWIHTGPQSHWQISKCAGNQQKIRVNRAGSLEPSSQKMGRKDQKKKLEKEKYQELSYKTDFGDLIIFKTFFQNDVLLLSAVQRCESVIHTPVIEHGCIAALSMRPQPCAITSPTTTKKNNPNRGNISGSAHSLVGTTVGPTSKQPTVG